MLFLQTMQRRFLFFYNPISGTKSKTQLLNTIKKRCEAESAVYEITSTNAAGDYNFLKEKITDEKITDIVVCGGDGTVNQVAAALLNVSVNIGIIPMGSGNGLALAAGIPKTASKALDVIFNGKATEVDGFYINQYFSCMLCGLGFDAKVAHDFAKQEKRGLATYVKQTVINFFSAQPYPFIIDMESNRIKTEAFFISLANSNQFGNNVTIAPKASISDGLIDVVIVKKMSKLKMVFSLLKQVKLGQLTSLEKKYKTRDILYFQVKQLSIQNPLLAPLHIDGDPVDSTKLFEIKIIEKAFRLLQP